jgi:hypothetical protein
MSTLTDALTDLEWIVTRWPDLRALVTSKAPERWKRALTQLDNAQRAERNVQAWLDRHDVKGEVMGEAPAPLNVGMLDLLAGVLMRCDMLHEHVGQTVGHPRLPSATGIDDDPRPFLAYVRELLPEACEADADMAEAAAERLSSIRLSMAAELGDLEDGHTLAAICPFCMGRTPKFPTGGAYTLRIRTVEVTHRMSNGEDLEAHEPMVVCESGDCRPFAAECSRWIRGNPAWPWPEWEWLAQRLIDPRSVGVA